MNAAAVEMPTVDVLSIEMIVDRLIDEYSVMVLMTEG
jgi:hypothetical protein